MKSMINLLKIIYAIMGDNEDSITHNVTASNWYTIAIFTSE
jgi:hypothetical protein